ncbi:MAG: hypothetical protein ABI823_16455 [Bryobacteraceae bacterium]
MILTKEELISAMRTEVRILVHLIGKIDPSMLDYRPTPSQRSTLELVQYMAIMGPTQIALLKGGVFNRPVLTSIWGPAAAAAKAMTFEQAVEAIRLQSDEYTKLLGDWNDDDFRAEVDMFGNKQKVGPLLVNLVLGGHAAYRTQLFCYLKSCGRSELSTMNLWAGVDAPPM